MSDYLNINRAHWDQKVDVHLNSDFYDQNSFLNGKNTLNAVELDLLGDIDQRSVLHMQCHFGQDSISMARMGAQVVGVDFSPKAVEVANNLSNELGVNASFVCCDALEAYNIVNQQYDIVFASYGVIGWHPEVLPWMQSASSCLKRGGHLILVDFHPVLWMFDDDFTGIKYSYFNKGKIEEEVDGTYADKTANIHSKSISWNHSLSEILDAILKSDLNIVDFQESEYSPYDCFNQTIKSNDHFMIKGLEGIIPMVYAIKAQKN